MAPAEPNLFLIGAMKAGTTSLAAWLGASEAVFVPRIKEPNHFSVELQAEGIKQRLPASSLVDVDQLLADDSGATASFAYIEDRAQYLRLYEGSHDYRYRLDASTTYLNSPLAAELIARDFPRSKIIWVARDPVERAWSEFGMNVRMGVCNGDYAAALQREIDDVREGRTPLLERYVTTGLYDRNIARFRAVFPVENIFDIQFEDIRKDFHGLRQRIGEFLEISDLPEELPRENSGSKPRFMALNRVLHATGLKYSLRRLLPNWLAGAVKGMLFTAASDPIPDDFRKIFARSSLIIGDAIGHSKSLP